MNFAHNKIASIREFYLPTGELEQKYDFTNEKLVYFKPENDETYHQIINGKDTVYSTLTEAVKSNFEAVFHFKRPAGKFADIPLLF